MKNRFVLMEEAPGGEGAAAGGTVETVTDWRDSLPQEMRDSPVIKDIPDLGTLVKNYENTKSMVGNSIRLPTGPESLLGPLELPCAGRFLRMPSFGCRRSTKSRTTPFATNPAHPSRSRKPGAKSSRTSPSLETSLAWCAQSSPRSSASRTGLRPLQALRTGAPRERQRLESRRRSPRNPNGTPRGHLQSLATS